MIFPSIFYDLFLGTILIYIIYKAIKITKIKIKYRWVKISTIPNWVSKSFDKCPQTVFTSYRFNGRTFQYRIDCLPGQQQGWVDYEYYRRLKK